MVATTTAKKHETWFNTLLDNYPNFDKVDLVNYGIK